MKRLGPTQPLLPCGPFPFSLLGPAQNPQPKPAHPLPLTRPARPVSLSPRSPAQRAFSPASSAQASLHPGPTTRGPAPSPPAQPAPARLPAQATAAQQGENACARPSPEREGAREVTGRGAWPGWAGLERAGSSAERCRADVMGS